MLHNEVWVLQLAMVLTDFETETLYSDLATGIVLVGDFDIWFLLDESILVKPPDGCFNAVLALLRAFYSEFSAICF